MFVDDVLTQESSEGSGSDESSVVAPEYSLAFMESLTVPTVQEVVISADMRCIQCQKRISDVISRFTETESVLVSLSEKKVVITCKYLKASKSEIVTRQRNLFSRIGLIKRIFGSERP